MGRGRDGSREWLKAAGGDQQAVAARDRLNEAVTELRRLTDDELFRSLERLCEVDGIGDGASVSVEGVRMLRDWSAGYLRLAAELEAAARCCRLIEHELRQQIDAPLAGSPGGKGHRVTLPGWLKAISPHSHPAHGSPDRSGAALPRTSPAQSPPKLYSPEADVAAMTLGPLEVIVAGRRVLRWNSLKARAVFQYLLIHRSRPVRRDVLMELQWPDHTHTSARNNLNVALHSLRNTLDGPWQSLQLGFYPVRLLLSSPRPASTAGGSARRPPSSRRPPRETRRQDPAHRGAILCIN